MTEESTSTSSSSLVLDFLKDKNVFVFDTETTGLPKGSPFGWGTYWDYRMNDKYDSARVLSIAWSSIEKFNRNELKTDITDIKHYLRYPEGFTEITTTHIHGISYNDVLEKGLPLHIILDKYGLGKAILDAEYVLAHNVGFDYNVLLNELYRIVTNNDENENNENINTDLGNKCIKHLLYLKSKNKIVCTGELSTDICKMDFPNKTNSYLGNKKTKKYKMPKLCELYKYFYNKDFENAHSADWDVKALLECLKMM